MHAAKSCKLVLGKHAAPISWDSQLASFMIRLLCQQHHPLHRPHSTFARIPSRTGLHSSRRLYSTAAGISADQDSSSQPSKTPQAPQERSTPPRLTIGSFLAPPGTEKHYNPHETIADSFSSRHDRIAADSDKSTAKVDPIPPWQMMDKAILSKNAKHVWHTYTKLNGTLDSSTSPPRPFRFAVYYDMVRCFHRSKSTDTAKWALKVYEDMKKYYSPNQGILNMMLDIMVRYGNINRAIDSFNQDIYTYGLVPMKNSYNIMIRGLGANGRIKEAEQIFEDMRKGIIYDRRPDVTTYSTMISQYIKNGMQSEADRLLDDMLVNGVQPNMYIFNLVVKRFVKQRDFTGARKVMTLMKESNMKPDSVTYSTLIDGYAQDGNEEAIAQIQTEMALNKVYPSAQIITSTIKVFARTGQDEDVDVSLEAILKSLPAGEMNDLTFGVLMNVYGKRMDLDAARGIYQHMISKGRQVNEVIVSSLLDGYVRANEIPTANKIFHDHFTAQDIRPTSAWPYSILITGCCKRNNLHDALHYYHQMNSFRIDPDATICSRLIQLYLEHHQLDNAQQMLRVMRSSRMEVSVHTYTMLIDYMSSIMDHRGALRYYQEMLDAGIKPDVHCYTVLINAHMRAGKYAACDLTYDQMIKTGVQPTIKTLTSMVNIHSIQDNVEKVKEYWGAMLDMGLLPDIISFTVLMRTYGQQGNVEMVEFIYKEINRRNLKVDAITLTTLISAYSSLPNLNVGRIDEISGVMEDLELEPTPDYFQVLLDAYGGHGMPDRVIKTWRQMQSLEKPLNWVPSTTNLLHLIEACRERGYIDILNSIWHAATRSPIRPDRVEPDSGPSSSMDPPVQASPLPSKVIMLKPAPEVFTAYLNALLTHNRFREIEDLLKEGCREMRLTPRTEDFELLFTGLAQYDFLEKELESVRRIAVQQWPRVEALVDKVVLNTRRL
ncbi:hypothetical protein BC939DRAFT_443214 [Gamsiella multidivaricata]|uniref:uncharacterized protein n=1 Tax=Gamsiella multidivaricata TaxID=101098 RepID=UPI00221FAF5F|nr:uncharacterized protein BC939DRAFT_443214 [Gamsiella multidivaricata]KAG0368653.1 hypothetical protein BGZ54_001464 [Gamsiella multidivaricata]KAI7828543.1 hypothetical protein BC939DRAFT_443214 [Gamsiella multidivaricata]